MVMVTSLQYGIPVIKYDRKGFKARQRQLLLTQRTAYVVELAKIKQKIHYSALKGTQQVVKRPPVVDIKHRGQASVLTAALLLAQVSRLAPASLWHPRGTITALHNGLGSILLSMHTLTWANFRKEVVGRGLYFPGPSCSLPGP